MRKVFGIAIVAVALSVVAPALAQVGASGGSYDDYTGGVQNRGTYDPRQHEVTARTDPETFAEDLRHKDQCEKAVPILRQLADNGSGYEISQYNLGLCLLDLAVADPQHPVAEQKEGAAFILEAANGGFGRAQAAAVGLYLDGTGVDADPVEAGKWALVYHENGMRLALGLPDIPKDVVNRLNAALGTKRSEARARALSWTPTTEAADR